MIFDSDWERQFAEIVQAHPRVMAFARNHNLGLEIPYLREGEHHRYIPDFVARIDDGRPDPLNLFLEVKGYRGHDPMLKAETTRNKWVPAVPAGPLRPLGLRGVPLRRQDGAGLPTADRPPPCAGTGRMTEVVR